MILGSSAAIVVVRPLLDGTDGHRDPREGLEECSEPADNLGVAQGGASAVIPAGEYRPSADTANWSLAAATGWSIAAIAMADLGFLFPASMCLALWLQCRQRLVVDGHSVHRIGMRAVVLGLGTAEVVCRGS